MEATQQLNNARTHVIINQAAEKSAEDNNHFAMLFRLIDTIWFD